MLAAGIVLAIGLSVVVPFATTDSKAPCAKELDLAGMCNNDGSTIVIDGSLPGGGRRVVDHPIGNAWPRTPPPKVRDLDFEKCVAEWDDGRSCYLKVDEDAPEDEDPVEIPPITITDVARFTPKGAVLAGEPENVGVAGLPTNFVATASTHTVDGELFGFPVTVRFTPSAFDFTFGDGTSATTTSGGESWVDLNQAQFTPTPTSHTYPERGNYAANVNVRYTAEVDFGVGWFPIAGEVTAVGPAQDIRIFEAHTALVAHTCEQAPSSPGC